MEPTKPREAPKTVKITVNGRGLEVPASARVIDAAEEAGVLVPRYCYHPDLSIAGVCRMCVVEVEKNPRLQISCNTQVAEGMVVRTDTPKVKEAVKSALELHLINHPLDCPICDKAGECKLQDFYSQFGLYESRMEFEAKVHKPKVVDIGTIVLDSERCILCTRCVRFTSEVTKTNEFAIFNRGDRSELKTYDDGPLRNDYTGNLADICPVGALTAKDFRFKQRVWFLDKTKSICTLCARGCNTNISINPHTKKLYRVEPRRNLEVNKSWMCDVGRWGYHHVSDDKRIRVPRVRVDGKFQERTWESAFQEIRPAIKNPVRTLVALSGYLTNEEVGDALLGLKTLGMTEFTRIADDTAVNERKPYDGILKHRDLTPNSIGVSLLARKLDIRLLETSEVQKKIEAKEYDWLWLFGVEAYANPGLDKLLSKAPASLKIVAHATSELPFWERAEWVLPNVSSFEKNGSMVNALGHLQRLTSSLPPQYTARDVHSLVFGLVEGNDRESVSTTRVSMLFETLVSPVLMGEKQELRKFSPKGVTLKDVPSDL